MYCPKCGNVIDERKTNCDKCGNVIQLKLQQVNVEAVRPEKRKDIAFCVAFLKRYGIYILGVFLLGKAICLGTDKYFVYLGERNQKQVSQLAVEKTDMQNQLIRLEEESVEIDTQLVSLEEAIGEVDVKLEKIKNCTGEVSEEDLAEFRERRQKALTDLQEMIIYIFEEYYALGATKHIYEEVPITELFAEDVISELSGGNAAAEGAISSFVEGIAEGQSMSQIKDNILENGSEWVTEDAVNYIGEKLLGSSVMSVLNAAEGLFSGKPQLQYLVNHLEGRIQNDYFECFYKVLALEEWNGELYYECCRKSEELQYILGKIEEYTNDDVGADIWRSFSYLVGVYGMEYYGSDKLLKAYGEE